MMIRVNITRDEWDELRKLAITERRPAAELVAAALRTSRVTKQAFETKGQTK